MAVARDADGLTVSPALRRTVHELGVEAERWLSGVPDLIAELSAVSSRTCCPASG
jgi:hypothetical protein